MEREYVGIHQEVMSVYVRLGMYTPLTSVHLIIILMISSLHVRCLSVCLPFCSAQTS